MNVPSLEYHASWSNPDLRRWIFSMTSPSLSTGVGEARSIGERKDGAKGGFMSDSLGHRLLQSFPTIGLYL